LIYHLKQFIINLEPSKTLVLVNIKLGLFEGTLHTFFNQFQGVLHIFNYLIYTFHLEDMEKRVKHSGPYKAWACSNG
jgi:hypothetical protein